MNTLERNISSLKEKLTALDSDEARYAFIIEQAKSVHSIPEQLTDALHKVRGCQSEMYISLSGANTFLIYSDALLSKGLASLVLQAIDGLSPQEITKISLSTFEPLGIFQLISPGRLNGIQGLLDSIKLLIISKLTNPSLFT